MSTWKMLPLLLLAIPLLLLGCQGANPTDTPTDSAVAEPETTAEPLPAAEPTPTTEPTTKPAAEMESPGPILEAPIGEASVDPSLTDAEFQQIAEEAFIYGFPMVMNYGVMYEYFINRSSDQYKCPINQIYNTARVYTPADTAVVTPNSDTPYSFVCADLRVDPLVLTVPQIEENRYFSVQLVDLYTCNFGYIGSRTTGNQGGSYLIAGPSWEGEKPEGIDKVFRCETEFLLAIIRTQLFDADDLENVKKIQAGYRAETLSSFLQQTALPQAAVVDWSPIDKEKAKENPFGYLAYLLQFCPPTGSAAAEAELRARFAKIGLEAERPFSVERLTDGQIKAMEAAMKSGMEKITKRTESIGDSVNGWKVSSAFGNREFFHGDWTLRAAAAKAGIYGNDAVEATYPMTRVDITGTPLDGGVHKYEMTFAADQLPPVHAFWSVTMYDGETQLLVANPIKRYLINSPMLPDLKKHEDGSVTLYIQADSPGADKESNWLPAPDGPIYLVMRLYWPNETPPSILPPGKGTWKPPAIMPAD